MAGTELRQQARVLDTSTSFGPGQDAHAHSEAGVPPGLLTQLRSQGRTAENLGRPH